MASFTDTSSRTEVDATADLARLAVDRVDAVSPDAADVFTFTVRNDETQQFHSLEKYLPNPRRQRGTTAVLDADSLNLILSKVQQLDALGFADRANNRVTAILNYEGWGDHRIALHLKHSREWQHWAQLDGEFLPQARFADHLQDGLSEIYNPPAADLVEIVRKFQAKRSLSFKSARDIANGEVQFEYVEETSDAGGGTAGTIEIPQVLTLRLPIYERGARYELLAHFMYRLGPQGVAFGYKLDRAQEVVDAAFDAEVEKITDSLPIAYGPAPEPVQPFSNEYSR